MVGIILAFILYLSTKVTYKGVEEEENERLRTAARMEFVELHDTSQTNSSRREFEEKLEDDEL